MAPFNHCVNVHRKESSIGFECNATDGAGITFKKLRKATDFSCCYVGHAHAFAQYVPAKTVFSELFIDQTVVLTVIKRRCKMPVKVLSSDDWFEIVLVKQTTSSITFQWTFRNPLDVPYDLFKVEKCYSVKRDRWETVYWGVATTLTVRCLEQNLCYSFRASILHQPSDGADFQYAYQSPIFKASTLPNIPSTMGLYRAVKKCQPGLAKRLLFTRPELVNVPVHGETFLYLAVRSNSLDLVNALLDAGANIDLGVPETSVTPLHLAVYQRNLTLVRHLIERGANVNAQNCVGMTVGHYAIDADDLTMLKYVLTQGISQETRDRCQWTLIFRALYMRSSVDIVRHLLERKCRLKVKDRLRLTPLYYAQIWGQEEILRLLRRRLKI